MVPLDLGGDSSDCPNCSPPLRVPTSDSVHEQAPDDQGRDVPTVTTVRQRSHDQPSESYGP